MSEKYPLYDTVLHKHYRMIGNIKEFEPSITTTHGTLTEGQYKRLQTQESSSVCYQTPEKVKTCPYKSGIKNLCDKKLCAWWSGESCLSSDGTVTEGRCPISGRVCNDTCNMWNNNHCKLMNKGE